MRLILPGNVVPLEKQPVSLAIGVFDGLHLGHQKIIHAALQNAKSTGGSAVAVTFNPHPQSTLAPEKKLSLIQPFWDRLTHFDYMSLDAVYVVRFDQALSENPPEAFLEELQNNLGKIDFISVGEEFRFGKNRSGNLDFLKRFGASAGFEVYGADLLTWKDQKVSSTLIRELIASGRFVEAKELLGRDFQLFGDVTYGDQLGTSLGFPTANMNCDGLVIPPNGVYAAVAQTEDAEFYPAAVNIGMRPTLQDPAPSLRVEAHLLDFDDNIYERSLGLEFRLKIRDEMAFSNLDELKKQIERDVQKVRELSRDF
jgi:riboflavin kinase / FMN adenylyltransferase